MTGTEYSIPFALDWPMPAYFIMNAARHVLYSNHLAAFPLGEVTQESVNGWNILKDERNRDLYFYLQFRAESQQELIETLETRLNQVTLCSPNFSPSESERKAESERISEILKAEGKWTLSVEFQLLRLKWYEE